MTESSAISSQVVPEYRSSDVHILPEIAEAVISSFNQSQAAADGKNLSQL